MLHNISFCTFPRLTDKRITNKDTLYELLFLSDLYCFQGKKAWEEVSSKMQSSMVRFIDPKLLPLFIL